MSADSTDSRQSWPALIELNVGGTSYTTTYELLTRIPGTRLAQWFDKPQKCPLLRDETGWLGGLKVHIEILVLHKRLVQSTYFYFLHQNVLLKRNRYL